jgi:hypothetical protein
MSAPHLHLVTHTEQLRQNDALYIGGLEAANATLAEELAQALENVALLRESNEHLLEHYAAVMARLADALEWRGQMTLAGIATGLVAVLALRWSGL